MHFKSRLEIVNLKGRSVAHVSINCTMLLAIKIVINVPFLLKYIDMTCCIY